jgi:hypothetical protein
MGGFDKIDLTPKNTSTASDKSEGESGRGEGKTKGREDFARSESKPFMSNRKKGRRFNLGKRYPVIVSVIAFILLLVGIPSYLTYKSALATYRQAKLVSAALKTQDIELASEEIKKTQKELAKTQRNFHFLIPFKFVPVISWYYNDADHLMNAGEHGLEAAGVAVDSIKPYADVLGLKGEGSFSEGSAEDRIKTAVLTIGKITPEIDRISESLVLVQEEMDKVNPSHYPEFIFGSRIKTQLTSLREMTDQGVGFVRDAKPLVKVLPSLLGETEAKKYLILFQNDKELRPTGGFITAYAIFNIDKGVITIERSEDIYNLDDSVPNKKRAPEPILKYLPGVRTFNLRDSNLSPDFIESMETFKEMYDRAGRRVEVDGIVAIDTYVLVNTIKILDDSVTAGGVTFNTQNDERCDCPQVIYELEDNISRPVNYIKEDRKGLLGDLLQAIMTKALSSSPKLYWGPLFQSFITGMNEKHIMAYLYNDEAQKGIEALNAAGRVRKFDGDYLHINETNFSGAKVNIFMQEEVENAYEVDKDGVITKTVTIRYKNPYPPSDCNLERGGLCLNAEYRDWFRIYVPEGSELIESDGSQVKIETYEDLGKTVFDGFLTVRPKGTKTFTIKYKLPFKLEKGSPLPLLIQKQPGTDGHVYTNVVNGKTVETFPLLSDKEVKLEI